ncbi:MAG: amino acid permease [Cyclobacteriaceae bacterium]|nr:amino acid permease [Cyclobacteriaceae bacterium]
MASSNKFGTFGGVFTPSILTILGVIMYLRLPTIVGQAGLWATLGIVIVAHVISLTTGLSVSSIATDKKVKAGGTYFMISRSLGLPIGGTLGLALFVGLSFSVSLYVIGFAESFLAYWNFEVNKENIRIAGSAILVLVTTITLISTSLAIKTQYFIMAAIALSLVSVLVGKHDYVPVQELTDTATTVVPLMVLFGIFFPAVTGFEAGVSMSGDLKDPKKSIPTGSIAAILVGLLVYIGLTFFFARTVNADLLANDKEVLLKISWIPELVVAGIWGATLSSALGSILGAPRILQATAVDGISHRIFSRGAGKANEPRNALLLTFVIAEAGILIGELDVIARVVSIFFITTYGFLNLSCAFERWTSADFRPDFKAPIWVSLLGAVACLLVMIQLDFWATVAASIVLGIVFFVLKRKELTLQSGDTWSGVWASLVKSGLEYLNTKSLHTRNWRPNILMFHGSPDSRPHLLQIGKDLCGKLGILTAFELYLSDSANAVKHEENVEIEEDKGNGRYFSLKYATKDIYAGIEEISRVYGFSGIKPNTILMGWTRNEDRQEEYGRLISNFNKNGLNSIFLNFDEKYEFRNHHSIDIWWSGHGSNLAFAISIIRYLSGGSMWKDPKVRLYVPTSNPLLTERIYGTLERIIDQYRIAVEINVVNNALEKLSTYQLIERESADTDLTIVGLPDRRYEQIGDFMVEINKLLPLLGSTLLINASGQFEEYDLELNEKISTTVRSREVVRTPIPQFIFPMLTEEIYRLDKEMDEMVHAFFEKALLPHIIESGDWLENLKESVETTTQNFLKASEVQDQYRRNKAFFKIKNEFYFKITSLFEKNGATNLPN